MLDQALWFIVIFAQHNDPHHLHQFKKHLLKPYIKWSDQKLTSARLSYCWPFIIANRHIDTSGGVTAQRQNISLDPLLCCFPLSFVVATHAIVLNNNLRNLISHWELLWISLKTSTIIRSMLRAWIAFHQQFCILHTAWQKCVWS